MAAVHLIEDALLADGLAIPFERDLGHRRLRQARLLIRTALPLTHRERRINQTFHRSYFKTLRSVTRA